jgi:hypothetical protein
MSERRTDPDTVDKAELALYAAYDLRDWPAVKAAANWLALAVHDLPRHEFLAWSEKHALDRITP